MDGITMPMAFTWMASLCLWLFSGWSRLCPHRVGILWVKKKPDNEERAALNFSLGILSHEADFYAH